MRILITVNDAYGHVLPLASTIHALAQHGHHVHLACPGPTARLLRQRHVTIRQYQLTPLPELGQPPPRCDRTARLEWAVGTSWPNVSRGWTRALLEDARTWRPDLVIVEPVEHAGRIVAAALGVPLIEHGWGFTLPAGVDGAAGEGLADVYAAAGASARQPDLRVDLGHNGIQATDIPPAVERYRYVPWSLPAPPLPPPSNGKPRILLTLGTFPHPDAASRLHTAAETAAALDADVIVAVGNRDRLNGGSWPTGVMAVDWTDLPAEVTRCALVIHHAGAGTSWATLAAGVPAVLLPQAGDQFRNAELLASAGVGLLVEPGNPDRKTLREALAHALNDPSMATTARRAQQENASLPGPDELATRLKRYVTNAR